MTLRVVALHHSPWPASTMARPSLASKSLSALYRYAVWYKSNPRSAEYMRALAAEFHPEAEWVSTRDQADWQARIAEADDIVLVYPDAIGLGFANVEAAVKAGKRTWAGVRVLNGRRRRFLLDGATRRGLLFRRFLEWTMLPELLFLPLFVAVTPVLWAIDLMRGRT
ncbi:MAG: glycine/betaine ABC transporter permease [Gammaproteobacteria bacterium]|nr:glycine/betaine ABC transporter permease [Gammaproteobacteria bacterium]